MEAMNKIDLKNIDKSNWQTFKFEDIAQKISKTVKPEEAGVDVYVGLEHLDREDIHIRRRGVPSDVKGGKLRCYPGDIIFGKRRAYQRKAAIVDFEGICSAHAFVFRAKPEVIDPKLFPFFLHSDQFMHRMIDISVGGLSPTINWGDLKHQEFLLPPKDQQAQLAKLLWALDEVIESELKLIETLLLNKKSLLKMFSKSEMENPKRLSNFIEIKNGFAFKGNCIIENETDKVLMTPGNFKIGGGFSSEKMKYLKSDEVNPEFIFNVGDMVVTMTDLSKDGDTLGFPAIVPLIKGKVILHNQRLGKVIFKNNDLDFLFLYYLLQTPNYRNHILNASTKTTVRHTYPDRIKSFKFNMLDKAQQIKWSLNFSKLDNTVNELMLKIKSSKSLQKSLINKMF